MTQIDISRLQADIGRIRMYRTKGKIQKYAKLIFVYWLTSRDLNANSDKLRVEYGVSDFVQTLTLKLVYPLFT